jgi:hypothetical protein
MDDQRRPSATGQRVIYREVGRRPSALRSDYPELQVEARTVQNHITNLSLNCPVRCRFNTQRCQVER